MVLHNPRKVKTQKIVIENPNGENVMSVTVAKVKIWSTSHFEA